MSGLPSATIVLVVEVLGLVFIGLVSVAGFSVMAQRRIRALGILSAIGATERNLRLVMIANGLVVGVAGALAGAVLGLIAIDLALRATSSGKQSWAITTGVACGAAAMRLAAHDPGDDGELPYPRQLLTLHSLATVAVAMLSRKSRLARTIPREIG